MYKNKAVSVIVLMLLIFLSPIAIDAKTDQSEKKSEKKTEKKSKRSWKKTLAWTGGGFAAGRLAGPAGSASFGAFRHRRDLAAGGRSRNLALVKIGAPIALGAAFGPLGVIGYQTVKHRNWLKRHLWPFNRRDKDKIKEQEYQQESEREYQDEKEDLVRNKERK